MIHEDLYNIDDPAYTPNRFIEKMLEFLQLQSDRQLANYAQLGEAAISRYRNRKLRITPSIIMRFHDVTGMDVDELRRIAGIKAFEATLRPTRKYTKPKQAHHLIVDKSIIQELA